MLSEFATYNRARFNRTFVRRVHAAADAPPWDFLPPARWPALGNLLKPCGLAFCPASAVRSPRRRRALVINIVGAENSTCELLQQIVLFIGRAVEPITRWPCRLAVANLFDLPAAKRSACFQVAGSSFPFALRTSGVVSRSGLSTNQTKSALAQRKSPFIPLLSRLSARTMWSHRSTAAHQLTCSVAQWCRRRDMI